MAEEDEFEEGARATVRALQSAPVRDRIAVACRGSANPAALAWLAESLEIDTTSVVIDLGAGLGGPAAWLERHYGCQIVGFDPAPTAALSMAQLFGLAAAQADAADVPLRDGVADAALLLGVISVVDDPDRVLAEARRCARRLGVLDYCSSGERAVSAGGSTFRPGHDLRHRAEAVGWSVGASARIDLPSPPTWDQAIADLAPLSTSEAERSVGAAIEQGDIEPWLLVAS